MLKTVNTILYCRNWQETVRFYRDRLQLPVGFSTGWFVEFILSGDCRLSVADDTRASVKTAWGKGITLSWETDRLETVWKSVREKGLAPTPIQKHAWNARVFYLFDPEGNRIEFWESSGDGSSSSN